MTIQSYAEAGRICAARAAKERHQPELLEAP